MSMRIVLQVKTKNKVTTHELKLGSSPGCGGIKVGRLDVDPATDPRSAFPPPYYNVALNQFRIRDQRISREHFILSMVPSNDVEYQDPVPCLTVMPSAMNPVRVNTRRVIDTALLTMDSVITVGETEIVLLKIIIDSGLFCRDSDASPRRLLLSELSCENASSNSNMEVWSGGKLVPVQSNSLVYPIDWKERLENGRVCPPLSDEEAILIEEQLQQQRIKPAVTTKDAMVALDEISDDSIAPIRLDASPIPHINCPICTCTMTTWSPDERQKHVDAHLQSMDVVVVSEENRCPHCFEVFPGQQTNSQRNAHVNACLDRHTPIGALVAPRVVDTPSRTRKSTKSSATTSATTTTTKRKRSSTMEFVSSLQKNSIPSISSVVQLARRQSGIEEKDDEDVFEAPLARRRQQRLPHAKNNLSDPEIPNLLVLREMERVALLNLYWIRELITSSTTPTTHDNNVPNDATTLLWRTCTREQAVEASDIVDFAPHCICKTFPLFAHPLVDWIWRKSTRQDLLHMLNKLQSSSHPCVDNKMTTSNEDTMISIHYIQRWVREMLERVVS